MCKFCGRAKCRCGKKVKNIACPHHGLSMKIVSLAIRQRVGWKWTDYALCMVPLCGHSRTIKYQGGPRTNNRKTNSRRK